MSTRSCPVCDKICQGYSDECIGEHCGEVACNSCASEFLEQLEADLEKSHVIPSCYNDEVERWEDIDMVIDPPN